MIAPITVVEGKAYPFGLKNCDTDIIISAEWLKTISRTGLGKAAFAALRDAGPTVFDDPAFAGSPILIGGESKPAMRRVARHGDGWLPYNLPVEDADDAEKDKPTE